MEMSMTVLPFRLSAAFAAAAESRTARSKRAAKLGIDWIQLSNRVSESCLDAIGFAHNPGLPSGHSMDSLFIPSSAQPSCRLRWRTPASAAAVSPGAAFVMAIALLRTPARLAGARRFAQPCDSQALGFLNLPQTHSGLGTPVGVTIGIAMEAVARRETHRAALEAARGFHRCQIRQIDRVAIHIRNHNPSNKPTDARAASELRCTLQGRLDTAVRHSGFPAPTQRRGYSSDRRWSHAISGPRGLRPSRCCSTSPVLAVHLTPPCRQARRAAAR